jgi:hypothetical protein
MPALALLSKFGSCGACYIALQCCVDLQYYCQL